MARAEPVPGSGLFRACSFANGLFSHGLLKPNSSLRPPGIFKTARLTREKALLRLMVLISFHDALNQESQRSTSLNNSLALPDTAQHVPLGAS